MRKKSFKLNFILSRQNQKGQVAIFVALIFQVVFVFFAVLINIGLLVHHKINLQNSADLSAYYGAMKQSEIMNAISHVNFQMKQAWKLLTWRYRIVGTFGFQEASPRGFPRIAFPLTVSLTNVPTSYNPQSEGFICANEGVGILDVPFFCAGHGGMSDWKGVNENNCRVDCGHVADTASFIDAIPLTGGHENSFTGGVVKAVNVALNSANEKIGTLCEQMGPLSFSLLAKFLMSYGNEVQQKKKLIQMLGANLSASPERAVDIEGGQIKKGSQKTFENNLTEANLSGKVSFDVMNGLDNPECAFTGNDTDGKGDSKQFLKEIKFNFIQFFIHQCIGQTNNPKVFSVKSIFKDADFNITDDFFNTPQMQPIKAEVENTIKGIEYILGYEKNPWCQVYYGVKAQSEPKIPFLPISKIRLSAISFAKPFGGSIGPRYYANWTSGQAHSDGGERVDPTLPVKNVNGIDLSLKPLKRAQLILPNYGNFVGDDKGLKDSVLVATYQDMLLHRQLREDENSSLHISTQKTDYPGDIPNVGITKESTWPGGSNWNHLADPSLPEYDYLSSNGDKNSYLRDLEISVIAPNQFDLTYFSIDADYYNNYFLKMHGGTAGPLNFAGSLAKIKSAAGGYGPDDSELKPDYGNNLTLQSANAVALNYSVRHQIAVASKLIKRVQQKAGGFPKSVEAILDFIPNNTSSLLTGWTFQNFSDYVTFPSKGPDAENTMTFGKCNDQNWNHTDDSNIENAYDTPASKNLPPTPGNCVWGGRTGYSVKILSPAMVRSSAAPQPYGGAGTNDRILNPAPESFFTF